LRANTAFRGILVPPGEHVIEMHYRSAALARGGWLALAAATALGLSGWFARRARR